LSEERGWIEAAQQGDAQAWEQLVRAHQQAIFRLAYLYLGDADDAEDVAQETFLRAYHALDRFDTAHALRPWLMRITTNLCHNWRRGVGRYLAVLRQVWRREPPAGALTGRLSSGSNRKDYGWRSNGCAWKTGR
jgi:RNA polymerase sigma-70 factor, ECF subfamily